MHVAPHPARHRHVAATPAAYPYNSGDGRQQKATLENVFGQPGVRVQDEEPATSSSSEASASPWGLGWQMSERNLVWNDQLKLMLIKVSSTPHASTL